MYYTPPDAKTLSDRLRSVLSQLEEATRTVEGVGDELLLDHLVRTGEIDPNDDDDFTSKKTITPKKGG